MAFMVQRGTNISHWLSQSNRRGAERRAFFTQEDVAHIADYGFDHLRLPVDEEQMWTKSGEPETEAFELLDAALDWADAAGLKVIVDLHILRSHYFNDAQEPRLYSDPAAQEKFAALWRDLSRRLHTRANEQVAYELLNEPVARDPQAWNAVASKVFEAIRALEPERTIVLGSNDFQQPKTFPHLAIPDDPHVLLSFHFYYPMFVTHYRASWWGPGKEYAGPTHYPGVPILPADMAKMGEEFRAICERQRLNVPYDREAMAAEIRPVLEARERTGLPLYCGEFGCLDTVPQEMRLAWYRDIVSVFTEYGIAWANWDYKGNFGIVTPDGQDTGIAAALLG